MVTHDVTPEMNALVVCVVVALSLPAVPIRVWNWASAGRTLEDVGEVQVEVDAVGQPKIGRSTQDWSISQVQLKIDKYPQWSSARTSRVAISRRRMEFRSPQRSRGAISRRRTDGWTDDELKKVYTDFSLMRSSF